MINHNRLSYNLLANMSCIYKSLKNNNKQHTCDSCQLHLLINQLFVIVFLHVIYIRNDNIDR